MSYPEFSILDKLIIAVDNGVRSIFSKPIAVRKNPANAVNADDLSLSDKKQSAALMRINHAGEVCAQALYFGQAATARSKKTKDILLKSGEEEADHLAWCQERLLELEHRTSYLNPFWYLGSFSIGLVVGAMSDKWSLGFVVETERQVEKHLKRHLELLPASDLKSQRIILQMCEDETGHATNAIGAGAVELPAIAKNLMEIMSKIMTTTAYYV